MLSTLPKYGWHKWTIRLPTINKPEYHSLYIIITCRHTDIGSFSSFSVSSSFLSFDFCQITHAYMQTLNTFMAFAAHNNACRQRNREAAPISCVTISWVFWESYQEKLVLLSNSFTSFHASEIPPRDGTIGSTKLPRCAEHSMSPSLSLL